MFPIPLRRNKPFATEIHNIYEEYKIKNGKGMKAPGILVPSQNFQYSLSGKDIEQFLINDTMDMTKLVEGIEEDIAGHIIFPDPIALYPNLIQAIQLLAIHERHHFEITERLIGANY